MRVEVNGRCYSEWEDTNCNCKPVGCTHASNAKSEGLKLNIWKWVSNYPYYVVCFIFDVCVRSL